MTPDADWTRRTTRWGRMRAWWLHVPGLDADHIAVLAALSTYADDGGFCEPSQATIARCLKRSRPWVNRVVAQLAEMGLIEKEGRTRRNGGTTSCRYRLASEPGAVAGMTEPVTNGDTPCPRRDTTQPSSEQIQDARPERAPPMSDNRGESVPLAVDWQPTSADLEAASVVCPEADIPGHTALFVAKSVSRGYRYRPGAEGKAWLAWLIEDQRDAAARSGNRGPQTGRFRSSAPPRPGNRLAAWAAAAVGTRTVDPTSAWQ